MDNIVLYFHSINKKGLRGRCRCLTKSRYKLLPYIHETDKQCERIWRTFITSAEKAISILSFLLVSSDLLQSHSQLPMPPCTRDPSSAQRPFLLLEILQSRHQRRRDGRASGGPICSQAEAGLPALLMGRATEGNCHRLRPESCL